MKRKPISKLICMALCFSMIAGSAGVVFANDEELLTAGSAGETYVEEFDSGDSYSEEITPDLMYTLESDDDQELYILNDQGEYPAEEYLGFEEDSEIPESEEDLIIQEPEEDLEFADPAAEEQEKEAFVNSLFEAALDALDPALSEETDAYEKAAAIYSCVSLSFTDVEITDEELAELTGKLLEYYGLENVILSGLNEEGSPVYWNLVRIGEIFYNLDVSLDRAVTDRQEWKGFLRGSVSPFGYVRDGQYLTEEFLMGNPVAEDAADSEQVPAEAQDTAVESKETMNETEEEEKSEEAEEAETEEEEEEVEAVEAEPDEVLNTASAGKSVWFGTYPQTRITDAKLIDAIANADDSTYAFRTVDGTKYSYGGPYGLTYRFDPVEWIVLGESGGYYKLLSKKVLTFCYPGDSGNWEDGHVRNNYLLYSVGIEGMAFTYKELRDMQAHSVKTFDESEDKWVTTYDRVSLLSASEISEVPSSLRIAYPTQCNYTMGKEKEKASWWLRDATYKDGNFTHAYVNIAGKVKTKLDASTFGAFCEGKTFLGGLRPVIWVSTSSKYLYTKNPGTGTGSNSTSIKLDKTSASMGIGDTLTLKATLSSKNKPVTWSSSNRKVATVTSSGKVKALARGTATITAIAANGKKATCKITVTGYKEVTKVTLNKTTITLNEGASQTLKATPTPATGTDTTWTWSSSNTKVATVDSKGKITAVSGGSATITVKSRNGKKATCKVTVKALSVQYKTHIQTYGWETKWAADGTMSGTEGQSKRLEGIYIRLANQGYSGDIQYRTHVQTYGWQAWKKNGQMAGTEGESKRLEAIQIKLTGDVAKKYDIYYRTHIQTFGWSGWAKNGEMCGSAGYSKRLEGINIKLVKKGGKAPGKTTDTFYKKEEKIKVSLKNPSLIYSYSEIGKEHRITDAAGITTDPSSLWTALSFTSSNTKVVKVVPATYTKLRILGPGEADIKVTAKGLPTLLGYVPGTATIHVKVLSEQKITIGGLGKYDSTNKRYNVSYTNQPVNIKASAKGGTSLSYTITDKNGKKVSSDIATIDKNGNLKFTGKKIGTFYVTVKAAQKVLEKGGYSAASKTFKVNVTKGTPVITCNSTVEWNDPNKAFSLGAGINLGGIMNFVSSDETVLKVDNNGVVTPVFWNGQPNQKEATVTITSKSTAVLNAAKTINVKVIIKNILYAFITDPIWKDGAPWGDRGPAISSYQSASCCAYCADFVKYCFGKNSPRDGEYYNNASNTKAGDVIHLFNGTEFGHWIAVINRDGNNLYVAEGNFTPYNGASPIIRIGWNYSVNGSTVNGMTFEGWHFM